LADFGLILKTKGQFIHFDYSPGQRKVVLNEKSPGRAGASLL
jgi:hypothetical protein